MCGDKYNAMEVKKAQQQIGQRGKDNLIKTFITIPRRKDL
jgi:hypothetical protein